MLLIPVAVQGVCALHKLLRSEKSTINSIRLLPHYRLSPVSLQDPVRYWYPCVPPGSGPVLIPLCSSRIRSGTDTPVSLQDPVRYWYPCVPPGSGPVLHLSLDTTVDLALSTFEFFHYHFFHLFCLADFSKTKTFETSFQLESQKHILIQ
jgi:hypothetical protein